MTELVEEPDTNQDVSSITTVTEKEGLGTLGRIRWSLTHCLIALGVIAGFRATFYLLGLWNSGTSVYSAGMVLWISMFAWMVFLPLWIVRRTMVLRWPRVGHIMKEFALAIPLAFCLLVVEKLGLAFLSNVSGGAVETNSTFSRFRGSPGDVWMYLLLIVMFTLGPLAEELFFRGLLYNLLRRRIGPLAAAVLQAFIFMLVHYKWPETGIVPLSTIFFAGVVLAGVYEWRKSLWGPIALHVLTNLAFVIPVVALMILNSHTPAQTWLEAEQAPDWLGTDMADIEKKATAEEQRLHAINTWGSEGLRMWKDELRGFNAVCEWFPDDRVACAQARVGIVQIYLHYLRDFRRAVVHSDRVLTEFRDQPEACVQVLLMKGRAYHELEDRESSAQCLREVLKSYPSLEWAREAALRELAVLLRK